MQIIGFVEAAHRTGPLRLARLAKVALFRGKGSKDGPGFSVGVPFEPEQGMQGVCNALGKLVAADVLPALAQAGPSAPRAHPQCQRSF